MSSNTRWLMLSYGLFAIIALFLVSQIAEVVMAVAELNDPLAQYMPLPSIIGLIGGLITFGVLFKHPRINEFGNDVVKEVKKVTWPTVIETRASTLVVIVLVLIVSLILGFFDYVFSSLTNLIYT